jgi:prophage regulatory protein
MGSTMANTNREKLRILRRNEVEKRTGLSRSTIYLRIQKGTFPKPINLGLGARAVGWLENEIENWLEAQIEKRDSREVL